MKYIWKMNFVSTSRLLQILGIGLVIAALISVPHAIDAQCPMCRAAAETNLASGGTEGKGLNKGILYMLALPYILVGTIGFIWWRNRKMTSTSQDG